MWMRSATPVEDSTVDSNMLRGYYLCDIYAARSERRPAHRKTSTLVVHIPVDLPDLAFAVSCCNALVAPRTAISIAAAT
ncbi:hypothetical protein GCM10020218_064490 [Dactylosporangium vinaceum]